MAEPPELVEPPAPTHREAFVPRARRACRNAFRGALARAALRVTSWLPLGAGKRLGTLLAPLAMRVPGRARNSMLVNLALCLPQLDEAERRRLATESLAEGIATMLELGPLWTWPRERVLALVRETPGMEALEAAVVSGRGAVLLGPHIGSWEIIGLFVSARFPMAALYRPPQVPALEQGFRRARERFGLRVFPVGARGVRELFRTVQRGGVVGVIPDQDPGPSGSIFVPFFGVPARTSTLAARLLEGTSGVPFLSWGERLEDGRGFRIHFVELADAELRCGDPERATRAINRELELLIRRFPSQYLWTYQRFRHRPQGERHPYGRDRAVLSPEPGSGRGTSGVTPAP